MTTETRSSTGTTSSQDAVEIVSAVEGLTVQVSSLQDSHNELVDVVDNLSTRMVALEEQGKKMNDAIIELQTGQKWIGRILGIGFGLLGAGIVAIFGALLVIAMQL